jgi:hypothetical protein
VRLEDAPEGGVAVIVSRPGARVAPMLISG